MTTGGSPGKWISWICVFCLVIFLRIRKNHGIHHHVFTIIWDNIFFSQPPYAKFKFVKFYFFMRSFLEFPDGKPIQKFPQKPTLGLPWLQHVSMDLLPFLLFLLFPSIGQENFTSTNLKLVPYNSDLYWLVNGYLVMLVVYFYLAGP